MAAAAALSSRSNHPVSKAVSALREAADRQLPAVDVVDFKLVPGAPPGSMSKMWRRASWSEQAEHRCTVMLLAYCTCVTDVEEQQLWRTPDRGPKFLSSLLAREH